MGSVSGLNSFTYLIISSELIQKDEVKSLPLIQPDPLYILIV